MKDNDTNQEFHFHYDSCLGRGPDSTDYVVELPAIRPDIPPQEGQYLASPIREEDHHRAALCVGSIDLPLLQSMS